MQLRVEASGLSIYLRSTFGHMRQFNFSKSRNCINTNVSGNAMNHKQYNRMTTTKKNNISPDRFTLYEKLVTTIPTIELKGASMPYTSFNGHMFSFLDKDGKLGLRLPATERNEFIDKHKTKLCEAHGTILKEYVLVPESLFKKTEKIKEYFAISFTYVSSLKPKPTKK